jgi:hypothetical protein
VETGTLTFVTVGTSLQRGLDVQVVDDVSMHVQL